MLNSETWLQKATAATKPTIATVVLQEYAILLDGEAYGGTSEELDALPAWQRTATTKKAFNVSPTGAAILPKSIVGHDVLPRVPGWRKILKEIGKAQGDKSRVKQGQHGHVADLLYDVAFQHHQSTNGRWNPALSRWERFGVRSVDGWRGECSKRTFHRNKDRLADLGLIDAGSHFWRGERCLWIKPTDELSRILFEPGYWDQVRETYAPAKAPKEKPASARKPRGISAKHKAMDEELKALYRKATSGEFSGLPSADRWSVWHRLTKPVPLGTGYEKTPLVVKGTSRYSRLHAALQLGWDDV